jgi:hypothetical protein
MLTGVLTWASDPTKNAADLGFSVELPGIEPDAKMMLTCGNAEVDYAKRREKT